jgi:hypothetical protein
VLHLLEGKRCAFSKEVVCEEWIAHAEDFHSFPRTWHIFGGFWRRKKRIRCVV